MCAWSPRFSASCARISVAAARTHGSGCSSVSASRASTSVVLARRTAPGSGRASASSGWACVSALQALRERLQRVTRRGRGPATTFEISMMPLADQPVDRVGLAGHGERERDPGHRLLRGAGEHPEPQQVDREVQGGAGVAGVAEPAQRGDHVVLLGLQAAEPVGAARAPRSWGSARSTSAANQRAWAVAGGLHLARLLELLERVLADRLEHAVALVRRPPASARPARSARRARRRRRTPRRRTPRSRPPGTPRAGARARARRRRAAPSSSRPPRAACGGAGARRASRR